MAVTSAGAAPLDQPAAPANHQTRIDAWFDEFYDVYLRRGWHPAVAAIEAELEARRHCKPVLP